MKLDYIDNINEYGDNVVRLYSFDKAEAIRFRNLIQQTILEKKKQLDLLAVDFIESRNCNLVLRITDEDEGITTTDNANFFCDLTINGYEKMIQLLEGFCTKETKGYQYLYDIDSPTDFLLSPAGTW